MFGEPKGKFWELDEQVYMKMIGDFCILMLLPTSYILIWLSISNHQVDWIIFGAVLLGVFNVSATYSSRLFVYMI